MITIEKNKRKGKCKMCLKLIDGRYKIRDRNGQIFHLSCGYKWLMNRIEQDNKMKKLFTGTIKKNMILEKL